MYKIKCSECEGSGKVGCTTCDGTGKVECKQCKGVGQVTCPTCGGNGKKYVKCPSCHDGYNIDPDDDRKVKCVKCKGVGKIESGDCADCKGTGKAPCKICSGSGRVDCYDCHGKGKIPCSKCHGDGGIDVELYCFSLIGADGIPKEEIEDYELLEQAAQAGSGAAAYVLGINAECEGEDEEFMRNFRLSAKADYVWGNYELGRLLEYENDPAAVKLLQRAMEQGSTLAAGELALIYYFGRCGEVRDVRKAVDLCRFYKGSLLEKEDSPHVSDMTNFMRHLESAVGGNADSLAWVAAATYGLLPRENENLVLEMLKDALAKGAQNIDQIYRRGGLKYAEGEIKVFKERYDQECKQKAEEEQKAKVDQAKKTEKPAPAKVTPEKVKASCSIKKRWKFIVLGLILGWMGAHFIYSKRWWLLLLHIMFVCATLAFPLCAILCLSTWFGGTFFVKKDGSGIRMA